MTSHRLHFLLVFGVLLLAGCGSQPTLPEPGTSTYLETVTAFYTGISAIQSGEDLGADGYLQQVTTLAPAEPAAWANLGVLALRRNELVEAATYLDQAVELAPDDGPIRQLRAALYAQQGDFDAAIAELREAEQLAPNNPKILYTLVQMLQRQGTEGGEAVVAALLDRLRTMLPANLPVMLERLRIAALQGDEATFTSTLDAIRARSADWPPEAQDLIETIETTAASSPIAQAGTPVMFLRNTLLSLPGYRQDLDQIQTSTAQVADLIPHFVRMERPSPTPASADTALVFVLQTADAEAVQWQQVAWMGEDAQPVPATYSGNILAIGEQRLGGFEAGTVAMAHGDLNFDYHTDVVLAGESGVRLYRSDSTGVLTEATGGLPAAFQQNNYTGIWLADVDLEGDLDIVLGSATGSPLVARNNGDGTYALQQPWTWGGGLRSFAWADFDADGDPDPAMAGTNGQLGIWSNERQGQYLPVDLPTPEAAVHALHATDLDADGRVEVLAGLANGAVVSLNRTDANTWMLEPVVQTVALEPISWLTTADLDNNGMLDLIATGASATTIWLAAGDRYHPIQLAEARVQAVADLNNDGFLDLVGQDAEGRAVWWQTTGTQNYRWVKLLFRAAQAIGDQRINAFAYGSRAEVRTGLLYQQRVVENPMVHVGLGTHEHANLLRVIWPNGDIQAEFDQQAEETIRTPQRLKGSCPWVFTYDGTQMRFVTDFLWRSPLGLRINAQETAGVMTTGDWVMIQGDQLQPRDGKYDIRITAELWETHFFDHVALHVIDHPAETTVLVDERFAFPPPPLALHYTTPPQPVAQVVDEQGNDLTAQALSRDDQYVGDFALGPYQGVAQPHTLEVDLGEAVPADAGLVLVAFGWVRPTDSSINVALSQGSHAPPQGLQVEVPDGLGGWRVLHPNLGFPSGKDKTVLIPLGEAFAAGAPRRVRLRTNLEIYWDQIQWAVQQSGDEVNVRTLAPEQADLRYRGFSAMVQPNRQTPERPVYDQLAGTAPRWMDLEGYYTRYGDVRPLLDTVDDRYVIMNAGDEFRFLFDAPEPPPPGWTRTFVLAGDGWVKDGDYNTAFSETVLPLPTHASADYSTPPTTLQADPVYQQHRDDWLHYHTRYVAPTRFQQAFHTPPLP